MDFDYNEVEIELSKADESINKVMDKYNNILMSLSIREKNIIQLYYYYRKLDTFMEMTPEGNYWDDKREFLINKVKAVIKKIGMHTYSEFDNLDDLRNKVNADMDGKLIGIVNNFSLDLKNAYKEHCKYSYTILPISGLKELTQSKHRENVYLNGIEDGVFASTDFDSIQKYIARANVNGMIVRDDEVIFPSNPFEKIEDGKIILKEPVSIYLGDIDLFEPQIDFVLDHHGFAHFDFNGEWIAPHEKIECVEKQVSYLPISFLDDKRVFYRENNEKIQVKQESRKIGK